MDKTATNGEQAPTIDESKVSADHPQHATDRLSAIERQLQIQDSRPKPCYTSSSYASSDVSRFYSPLPFYAAMLLIVVVFVVSLIFRQQLVDWQANAARAVNTLLSGSWRATSVESSAGSQLARREAVVVDDREQTATMASVSDTARRLAGVDSQQLSQQFLTAIRNAPEDVRLRYAGALFNELRKIAPDVATEREYEMLSRQLHEILLVRESEDQ